MADSTEAGGWKLQALLQLNILQTVVFPTTKSRRRSRKRVGADIHTRSVQGTVAWMLLGNQPTAFSE
jgi:hypothetical protein